MNKPSKNREASQRRAGYDETIHMAESKIKPVAPKKIAAGTSAIVLAFACVYFFWGSTYTAIRIGGADAPSLLFTGTRFLISGALLLAWCRVCGMRMVWPFRTMAVSFLIGLLLLGCGNLGLVFAERTIPSGLASLVWAIVPIYTALGEMMLPGGEPLSLRGWAGIVLGVGSLWLLVMPSLRTGLAGDRATLTALIVMFVGALCWAVGSLVARRSQLEIPTIVGASWQMLAAGAFNTAIGTALGQWPQFHPTRALLGSLAYLIVCGSLIGYTAYIYLLDNVPVTKVASNAYVNPVVAVLLGIFLLHERPAAAEFAGMAGIVLAVFLLTTAKTKSKGRLQSVKALEELSTE